MHGGLVFGSLAHVASIAKADFDGLARGLLHPPAQYAYLRLLLFVDRDDGHAQQVASSVTGDVGLTTLALFAPLQSAQCPLSGMLCKEFPLKTTALVVATQPGKRRCNSFKSCTRGPNTRASRQRSHCAD